MDNSFTCLVGKIAMVTGANTGIGFYTAQDFAKRGARVILACRNKKKAEEAKKKIIDATGNPNVVVRMLNFASLKSVRECAAVIINTEERLHILVNNAGAIGVGDVASEDGLNLLMQVNYFGPFLFTLLLIDLMKKSAPSRIVNVSSLAAHMGKLNPDNLNAFPKTAVLKEVANYSNSKLCNILFTNELSRRLKGSGVITNSVHPGVVSTELVRYPVGSTLRSMSDLFFAAFAKSGEEGAQTSIYLAVSKDVEGVSGEYFENCKIAWMPGMAKDKNLAKEVWEKSEKIVKLTAKECHL